MDHRILQVMDYAFVIGMGAEIWLRVLAEGLLFTPKAVVKDTAGILDICVSSTSFQKNDIGWPQQPPTEKVLKFNMIFHDYTPIFH